MTPRQKDKVYHWANIARIGTVLEVVERTSQRWLVGGMPGGALVAIVEFQGGAREEITLSDLRIHSRP